MEKNGIRRGQSAQNDRSGRNATSSEAQRGSRGARPSQPSGTSSRSSNSAYSSNASEANQSRGHAYHNSEPWSELRGKVREQAQSMFESGRGRIGERARDLVQSVERFADQLQQSDDAGRIGEYVSQAVARAHQAVEYIESKDPEEVLEDLRDLARRERGLVLGGAFVVGLVASRFLRSSLTEFEESQSSRSSQSGMGSQARSGRSESESSRSKSGRGAEGQSRQGIGRDLSLEFI